MFNPKKKLLLALFVLFLSMRASSELLTLQKAVQVGLENSPEVSQLIEQYESARAKSRLAIAPNEPSLALTYGDLTQALNTSTSASHSFVITQAIGLPGRAFQNQSVLDAQAEALAAQAHAMQLQVSLNVKTAYYNLQLAQRNVELNGDTRLAYERILDIAKRRYESGATAQVDFLNAQVQLLNNDNDLADLKTAESVAMAQLNIFLHQEVKTPISVEPIQMSYRSTVSFAEALEKMLNNRQEIRSARALERAASKAVTLAWLQLAPDFQFSFGQTNYDVRSASPYSAVTSYSSYNNWPTQTYSAGVQVNIPLWFLFNEREVIRGASRDHAAAMRAVDVLYNQSRTSLETTVDTLESTKQKIINFEKHILPLSEQALKLALIDYSSGKLDFQTLSATAAARRTARLNYAQAVVTYLTEYAAYGQLIGEDLQ